MVIFPSLSFHVFETEAVYSLPLYPLLSTFILGLPARLEGRRRHPLLGGVGEYVPDPSFFLSDRVTQEALRWRSWDEVAVGQVTAQSLLGE